jgi:hypothetical protein
MARRLLNFDAVAVGAVVFAAGFVLTDAYLEGTSSLRSGFPSSNSACDASNLIITAKVARNLELNGFVLIDNILSLEESLAVAIDLQSLHDGGRFSLSSPNNDNSLRRDKTCFLEQSDRDKVLVTKSQSEHGMKGSAGRIGAGEGLLHVQDLLRGIGNALEKQSFTGFERPQLRKMKLNVPNEVQIAVYGPGQDFYKRHFDGGSSRAELHDVGLLEYLRCASYRARSVTCILYLNPGLPEWSQSEDGGCLRIHNNNRAEGDTTETFTDIVPRGGRLLIFDSKTVEHEVRPTSRLRSAATIWFTS